jgi:two-component system NarL family response regulator
MNIRTLLVDDHAVFREALQMMLSQQPDIEIVDAIGDGALVEEAVARLGPDVVVMDINMPTLNGIEATRRLRARFPALHVVALSAFGHKRFISEMLDAGATAYVVKSAASDQLIQAIRSVAAGKTFLCAEATVTLVESTRRGGRDTGGAHAERRLGRRETEVLRLLAEGKSSPQIAEALFISPSTVDVHRRNIMQKLELHNVADLTKYAIRIGLTDV